MIHANTTADTPYGVVGNQTVLDVTDIGEDGILITFNQGPAKIKLAIAGASLHEFLSNAIDACNGIAQARLNPRLDDVARRVA